MQHTKQRCCRELYTYNFRVQTPPKKFNNIPEKVISSISAVAVPCEQCRRTQQANVDIEAQVHGTPTPHVSCAVLDLTLDDTQKQHLRLEPGQLSTMP